MVKQRETGFPSASSLLKYSHQLALGQADHRSQELHLCPHISGRGPIFQSFTAHFQGLCFEEAGLEVEAEFDPAT